MLSRQPPQKCRLDLQGKEEAGRGSVGIGKNRGTEREEEKDRGTERQEERHREKRACSCFQPAFFDTSYGLSGAQ